MDRRKLYDHLVFWITSGAFLLFLLVLISAYTPLKIIHSRYTTGRVVSTIYNARWNVYVGTPFEPVYRLYRVENNRLSVVDLRPFTPEYLFGLKRDPKLIAQEITVIVNDSAVKNNLTCYNIDLSSGGDINNCIKADTLKYIEVRSGNVIYLRGSYVITKEETVAWQDMREHKNRKQKLTVIPVKLLRR